MIDGVMILLLVAVWKLTVAMAWQNATTPITITLVSRSSAMRQNPGVPNGSGLSQASRPPAKNTDSASSTTTTMA